MDGNLFAPQKQTKSNNKVMQYLSNTWKTPIGKTAIIIGGVLIVSYMSGKLMRFFSFVVADFKELGNIIKS